MMSNCMRRISALYAISASVGTVRPNNVRPALAGSYAYVNPVIAVVLGVALAHEQFRLNDLVPMAIIVLAVLAMTLGKAARGKPVLATAPAEQ